MRRQLFVLSVSTALLSALAIPVAAAPIRPAAAVAERPLVDIKPDARTGKIVATFPKPGADGVSARYIYLTQLESGLGSAQVLLDKATPGRSRILAFRRIGKKVAAEIENPKFVARNGTADEQQGVRQSFATSTIWMGDVLDSKPDGSFTVDLAGFLARDDLDVPRIM